MRVPSFKEAVSADLHHLQSFLALAEPSREPLYVYMTARRHYLAGDLEALQAWIQDYKRSPDAVAWLTTLMELRLCIRHKTSHPREDEARSLLSTLEDPAWSAEAHMVLGMYDEELKRFEQAARSYQISARLFHALSLEEKSLTAEYNALIAQTLAHPGRRYLVAYHSFVKRALSAGDKTLAGVAMANLSREYQLLGLNELAHENSEKALQLLQDSSYGTLHYFLAVAQELDLLLTLGRLEKTRRLHEQLLSSPYAEVAEIVKVLERCGSRSPAAPKDVDTGALPAPWAERLKGDPGMAMSDLENEIVAALIEGPKSLAELAERLYGDKIQHESALARAKQAVYRLRRKKSDLIAFRKGRYELVD